MADYAGKSSPLARRDVFRHGFVLGVSGTLLPRNRRPQVPAHNLPRVRVSRRLSETRTAKRISQGYLVPPHRQCHGPPSSGRFRGSQRFGAGSQQRRP
ncbi:hypothetical protein MRX96_022678 [Rhipicephalus microplus]